MSDCRFGVSPVNYPDPDPGPDIKLSILVDWSRSFFFFFFFFFCLLLGPPGFNCCFCSSVPVVLFDTPGVGRNTLFLSSPHLCFIIVFISLVPVVYPASLSRRLVASRNGGFHRVKKNGGVSV